MQGDRERETGDGPLSPVTAFSALFTEQDSKNFGPALFTIETKGCVASCLINDKISPDKGAGAVRVVLSYSAYE